MKTIRIVLAIIIAGLVGFSMGPVGCGGGVIPFGGGKSLEEAVTISSPEEGVVGVPQPASGEITVPVVTEAAEGPSTVPCLMNYALAANPDYILVIKSNAAVLAIMGILDFSMFSSFINDASLIDDLLANADELVIAGGESLGVIALVRVKADIVAADPSGEEIQAFLQKFITPVFQAMDRTAMQTGIPAPEDIIVASFTGDPSAYIIGSAGKLANLVNQTAAIACSYCTVGACKASSAPMLYLSLQGAAFYEWVKEILVESGSKIVEPSDDALATPFATSRFVLGVDVDEEKEINAAMALLDGKECLQDKLIASMSAYIDVSKGFGRDLLNALLSGVLSSTTVSVIKEATPEQAEPEVQTDAIGEEMVIPSDTEQTFPVKELDSSVQPPAGVVSPEEIPELKDQSTIPVAPVGETIPQPQIQIQRLKTPQLPEKQPDFYPQDIVK